jgi:hypothetical protein
MSKVPGQRRPNDRDMESLKADPRPEHVVRLDDLHAQQSESAPGPYMDVRWTALPPQQRPGTRARHRLRDECPLSFAAR